MTYITQQQLRQLCQASHDAAETTSLAQALISGSVTEQAYKQLCFQQYIIADAIEARYDLGLADLVRRHALVLDMVDCAGPVSLLPSTKAYLDAISSMHRHQLRGHVYVHYMGWLYGGQMIAKKLSLPVNHLRFQDAKACITHMREHVLVDITTDDALDAASAFRHVMAIYQEIMP